MLGRIRTVAARELRGYFDQATAYILLVVFLAVGHFFFFRDAYLVGEASLRPLFGLMPWLLLFFVPAVAMRSLAEERRAGTLEVVLAQPVSELEFLAGKFLGVLAFLAVAVAGTLGVPVGLSFGADLQWGVIVAQYAGTLLLSAGLAAIGLWASSLTRNQVTAFIVGVAVIFLLYLLGLEVVLLSLPPELARIANRLGVLGHYENIARGVVDLRDALYFVSLAAAFLALAYHALLRERLSRGRAEYRRLAWGTTGLVGLAVLASLLGAEIRGRLDLTPGNAYTLSDATKRIVGGLDDLVTVKLFASRELPPQFGSVARDVEDLLRDFDAAGGASLWVVRRVPGADDGAREEASALGIPPIEFNVLGEEELQVRRGYLGIAVQYAGETETLPVVQRTEDLEYRLASAIRSLTRQSRPVVAFLQGHGEAGPATLRRAGFRLRDEYEVETLRFDSVTVEVPDSVDVVVVVGPESPVAEEAAAGLRRWLARGGSALLLYSAARVDPRSGFAAPAPQPALDSLLAGAGIRVVPGLAYDVRLNARIPLRGEAGITYFVPYPPWPVAGPASDHVIARDLGQVLLPWASPLEIEPPAGEEREEGATSEADAASEGGGDVEVVELLRTSEFGGRMEGPASVDPSRDWGALGPDAALGVQTMAVAATGVAAGGGGGAAADGGGPGDASGAPSTGGRLVVIGTSDLVADDFVQGYPENLDLFQNAVDWLAQDEALIAIRSKDRSPPRLLFETATVRDAVKYGNLIGVPLLFVLFGILRLARRRRLQSHSYRPAGGAAARPARTGAGGDS